MDTEKMLRSITSLRESYLHRDSCRLRGRGDDVPLRQADCTCHERNVYAAGFAAGGKATKDRCIELIMQCLERDPSLAKVAEAIQEIELG